MTPSFDIYYKPGPDDHYVEANTSRKGCRWQEEEEVVLRNLFVSGTDPVVIANNMGRTLNGILAKLNHMNLIRWSLGYKAYFKTPQLPKKVYPCK